MRRWKMWLLFVAAAIGLAAGGAWYNRHQVRVAGDAKVTAARAELDAADPGWRLDAIAAARAGTIPPDAGNAYLLAAEVRKLTPAAFQEWADRQSPSNPFGPWLPDANRNQLPNPDARAEAERVWRASAAAIARARQVVGTPRGGVHAVPENPLDGLNSGHIADLGVTIRLLELDAAVAALDRQPDVAVASLRAALTAARSVGDEPAPYSSSVHFRIARSTAIGEMAERVVGWCEPAAGLVDLQAAFLAEADEPRLAAAFRGERAVLDRIFEAYTAGRIGFPNAPSDPDFWDRYAEWRYRPNAAADHAAALADCTRLLAIARKPSHEQKSLLAELVPQRDRVHRALSGLMLPLWEYMPADDWRSKAVLRSAAVGLACERYRRATGRWPDALSDIPKDTLPAVPLDPYDGQPLRYRRTADGAVVYSVGPDRRDDGGNQATGPPRPGEDIGFRLWDVARRAANPE